MKIQHNLLPAGFHDILPPDAATETRIISKLLKNFELFGYKEVNPPMVEFESSLPETVASKTFRVMDPASHKMMSIRSDITMQIARMAAVRMKEKNRPLRLSYGGQVLLLKGDGLHKERQLSQVGLELIGDSSPASTAECILIAVNSLQRLNINDISIDFSIPDLSDIIMKDASEKVRQRLFELIKRKDIASIKAMDYEFADLLASLVINDFSELDLPEEGRKYFTDLNELIKIIKTSIPDLKITIDPIEKKGFEYHRGVGFSFFSVNNMEELGRGGRYFIDTSSEYAIGFTFYVDAIQRTSEPFEIRERVYIPYGVKFEETKHLREKNIVTVHGLAKVDDVTAEAERLECTSVYGAVAI